MKRTYIYFLAHALVVLPMIALDAAQEVELDALKDTFGRSNQRNLNNGASTQLLVAQAPSVRTIVGFDLSSITNEIVGAEFQVRMQNTMPDPITLVVAPMVQTTGNAQWIEGAGSLGVRGQNARVGEATFSWRAFRDQAWESPSGAALSSLNDSGLWKTPVATRTNLQWLEGQWIKIPIGNVSMVEKIRKSETKIVSFGLWGTSGKGLYGISSRESGHAPKLVLTLASAESSTKTPIAAKLPVQKEAGGKLNRILD